MTEREAKGIESFCTDVLYECLTHDKPESLQIYLSLYQAIERLGIWDSMTVWNMKMVLAHAEGLCTEWLSRGGKALIQLNYINSLKSRIREYFERRKDQLEVLINSSDYTQNERNNYIEKAQFDIPQDLNTALIYYDIPYPSTLQKGKQIIHDKGETPESLLRLFELWDPCPLEIVLNLICKSKNG